MTIYALDELLDTSSTDSQVPDSEESNVSADFLSSAEIYSTETQSEVEQGSQPDALTETTSYTELPDYFGTLEAIEADAHVILYVLLLFLVILFLYFTYKLYNFIMR